MTNITDYLFSDQDAAYAEFQRKLMPTVTPETVIGVRTPVLRAYAKELVKAASGKDTGKLSCEGSKTNNIISNAITGHDKRIVTERELYTFLSTLPHTYFEENQLHAFIISLEKDYDRCLELVEAFLPYVDNWATCDQLNPKVFGKNTDRLLLSVERWIASDKTYTVRFAIRMLMVFFLDKVYDNKYPEMVAAVKSDEYYINMMIAWYYATALAKQYESIVPFIEEKRLDTWTHNMAIRKAVESYRITDEQKAYLRTLKIK